MDSNNGGANDEEATPSSRRPRAPTITIDTTAVNSSPSIPQNSENAQQQQQGRLISYSPVSYTDEGHSPSTTIDPMASSCSSHQRSLSGPRPDLHGEPSFESGMDSRPTSPHNVSSPVLSRGNDRGQNFLAVPSALRSRQNSVDSEDGSRSFVSSQGDTMIGSTSYQGDGAGFSSISSSDNGKIRDDKDALKPDQGQEEDFKTVDNPFAFSPGMLNKLLNPKSLAAFYKLKGLEGIEKGLQSDRTAGLSVDETRVDKYVSFEEATGRADSPVAGEGETVAAAAEDHHHHQPPLQAQTTHSSGAGHATKHDAHDGPFSTRKRIFKDNRLPEKKGKGLLQLMWITYNDKVLILLSIAAVVSLAIGLYQTFGQAHDPSNPPVEWVEGVAIIVAIVIVVVVGSLNDYQKERQFANLNKKKQDRIIKAIRSGKAIEMSVFDILAGDVLLIEPGDMIPVDGILIEGFNVKCDESQATGESEIIRKRPADEVYAAIESNQDLKKMDPFIQSGAHVMEGRGTFMATSTGVYSSYGRTMMSLEEDPEITPLQSKLNVIAEYIAKVGGAAGLLLFIVLFIEFLVRLPHNSDLTPTEKGQLFLNIFIVVVTIIVVAVPEGLPLAVTLALAYATNRMLKDNNLVRHLKACEVMGNATTICSDKTGTLTQNKMQVVVGTVGTSHRFGGASPVSPDTPVTPPDKDITAQEFVAMLCAPVRELLRKSIVVNSTAFEGEAGGANAFIGSKTETALLIFAREHLAMGSVSEERSNAKVLQFIPFDSGRKCMGVVVQLEHGRARLYVKGASEIMLEKCDRILRDPATDVSACALTDENREAVKSLIQSYASHSLRTIGIIYRDFERWPPRGARRAEGEKDEIVFEELCRHMTFVSMVGIKDPLRPGVPEAVRDCQRAGVVVRMVTGDNVITARAIAKDCGILQDHSVVMEGPEFRNLSKARQEEIIPNLHVLARSSPEDKRVLVKRLKEKGETVAVTGDGTNDAPALKLADVGFSMFSGTEVAKEASAIILMDDNFNSIVKALRWGRAVNDAVKRFLQFQLTVNVTAVLLTFVSAVQSPTETSVLTAVQLLWVNLIMDTLAALALATDPPQASVLNRKPERRGASIISTTMWKMILGQALYQLIITFLIYFGAPGILPGHGDGMDAAQVQTLVFNTFVWMQIFNQWNNRRLDNEFNIFEGLTKNKFFLMINLAICGAQVLIIIFGGRPFNIAPNGQTPAMWAYALVLGFLSIPVGIAIRLVPDSVLARLVPDYLKRKAQQAKVPGLTVSDEERFSHYPVPLVDVGDQLVFLKRIKGGRLNNLKFALNKTRDVFTRSREHSRSTSIHQIPQTPSRENSFGSGHHSTSGGGVGAGVGADAAPPTTPDYSRRRSRSMRSRSRSNSALGAATVMSGIVAATVGVAPAWSPIDRRDSDFGQLPPSMERSHSHSHSQSQSQSHSEPPVLMEEGQPLVVEPPQGIQQQQRANDDNAIAGPSSNNTATAAAQGGVPILKLPKPPRSPSAEQKPPGSS